MKYVKLVVFIVFVVVIYDSKAQTQKENPTTSSSTEDEVLQPLTDAEHSLDFQKLLLNQPDFMADEIFFYSEGFGGFSVKNRIAKKGNRYLVDTGFVKVITEDNRAIQLNDSDKTFDESIIKDEISLNNGLQLNPQTLAKRTNIKFLPLGKLTIDDHESIKVEAKLENVNFQVFLYFAEDLNYLIIALQVFNSQRGSIQRLQNISLSVPNGLVEIPSDYKPILKFRWTRVDSAKVFYDGKLQKHYNVFRSENGNQLFVTTYEPHPVSGALLPWHYLVYLKKQIAEIAYQGMLMTKEGDFAWESKENEATSIGENKPGKNNPLCKGKKCPKTVVGANFIEFPSVYYDDRKSIVKVTW